MITKQTFSTTSAWLDALLKEFQSLVNDTLRSRDRMHVALSGGSTPKPFYDALAHKGDLPWGRIEWWLGDERWVPATNPASNEKMIRESLAAGDNEFAQHFHSWHLDLEAEGAARLYEAELRRAMGNRPAFDLILLGLGTDGHTASLFPGTPVLQEKFLYTSACFVPQMKSMRVTLTYPCLNAARNVWFLVQGREKEARIAELLNRGEIPSAKIQTKCQKLFWLTA